jgi:trk system potassium uptake protein TrkA
MRVVIVGGGADGSYLAERLVAEGEDVAVIEVDPDRAAHLRNILDALIVVGNGASPIVQTKAGVPAADLLIALSDNDGANVVACQTAAALGVGRTVARVEDRDLRRIIRTPGLEAVIDSRESTARKIVGLVQQGGASELVRFCDDTVWVVGGVVQPNSMLIGSPVFEVRRHLAGWDFVVAAVIRNGATIIGRGDTTIEAYDRVLLSVTADNVSAAVEAIGVRHEPVERAIVVGGGRVAETAAEYLTDAGIRVVLVHDSSERTRAIALRHRQFEAVVGDSSDPSTMRSLAVGPGDAVLGLTRFDERNILACLIGSGLGASTTIARYNRIALFGLLPSAGIVATVSSKLAVANSVLRFVRRGSIMSVATFMASELEALEMEVEENAPAVGVGVVDLDLPDQAVVGAVLRDGKASIPTGETAIEASDRVVVLALPAAIPVVERLFTA